MNIRPESHAKFEKQYGRAEALGSFEMDCKALWLQPNNDLSEVRA